MINYYTTEEKISKLVHPCRCNKCENPCKFGSGAFIGDETKYAAKFFGITKLEFEKKYTENLTKFNTTLKRPIILRQEDKPYGNCIFYEENKGCKIHKVKPYECKIAMGCKKYGEELITWFDLKYFFNPEDPESVKQFKTYVDSGGHVLEGVELEKFQEKLEQTKDFKHLKKAREKDWESILGIKCQKPKVSDHDQEAN